jgi:hypothetical protein
MPRPPTPMPSRVAGPLERAIAAQSAEWLEATQPAVFDALQQELAAGRSALEIRRILRRMFGADLRDALVLRILQAADALRSEG